VALPWTCITCAFVLLGGSITPGGTALAAAASEEQAARAISFNPHILVDQFGYRPGDPKVAVIRDPHVGYDAKDTFSPGATYQVRRAADGAIVLTGAPVPWHHGAIEPSSGDAGWWFDFSKVSAPGRYFVYDAGRDVRSAEFAIATDPYRGALEAAMRMFFYQRSGSSNGDGAKRPRYAGKCWSDEPAFIGREQDSQAHDATDPRNVAKVHDLSGGWFDAGDTNKYVTFAATPVHQLLTAYQNSPQAFGDDTNIPESGNGIPDVIDEVRYEIEWLERMQFAPDGSVALKVGSLGYPSASPPT